MITQLKVKEHIASKPYSCDAWHWMDQCLPELRECRCFFTFSELRSIAVMKSIKGVIYPASKYRRYTLVDDTGNLFEFKCNPVIDDIMYKYGLYPDDNDMT